MWRRDKVGFETPERAWLDAGETRQLIAQILTPDARIFSLLDPDRYRRDAPRLRPNDLFRLLCLELTMRTMRS